MPTTVGELLSVPHLQMRLLCGHGGLERTITWAHASDLPDPWGWLAGGELLLKNGRTLPADERSQVSFIEQVNNARSSGLVIGSDPDQPSWSAAALQRADQLDLPIVEIPYSMSFIVLSRAVADAMLDERSDRSDRTEKIYDSIHEAVVSDDSVKFLLRLEHELGGALPVIDATTFRPIFAGARVLNTEISELLDSRVPTAGTALSGPLRLEIEQGATIIVVDVPFEEPTLVVLELEAEHIIDQVLIQHAATAIAVEVAHASLRADYERQLGAETFDALLNQRLESALALERLARHEVRIEDSFVVALSPTTARDERHVDLSLRRNDLAHVMVRREDTMFILATPNEGSHGDGVASAIATAFFHSAPNASLGVSNEVRDLERIPAAAREALWALAAPTEDSGISHFGAASPLLGLHDPDEAVILIDRILSPLIYYDESHHTDLIRSLSIYLEEQRSWQRCAERLHVHRQTVIYRIKRIEELTGRSLSETANIALFWLALQAMDILQKIANE